MNTDPPSPDAEKPKAPTPPRPRGKVFDVMRPGKAATPPMTRPVVVGHKPFAEASQMKVSGIGGAPVQPPVQPQPQHAAQPDAEAGTSMADKFPPRRDIVSTDADASTAETHQTVGDLIDAAAAGHAAVPAEPDAQPEPAKPEKPAKKSKQEEEYEEDMPPDVPVEKLDEAALDPEPAAPAPAEPEPQVPHPAADPLADAPVQEAGPPNLQGQVVVSHHTTAPSGVGKMVFLIILMVLLALTVVDLLMDVGLLSVSGVPHTHLF